MGIVITIRKDHKGHKDRSGKTGGKGRLRPELSRPVTEVRGLQPLISNCAGLSSLVSAVADLAKGKTGRSLLSSCLRPSVFVAFVIFPYCVNRNVEGDLSGNVYLEHLV